MILSDPCLAKCSDRLSAPKINEVYGDPLHWLSTQALAQLDLHALSFDFFINWSTKTVSKEVWVKKILSPDYSYNMLIRSYKDIFKAEIGLAYINNVTAFARKNHLQPVFVVFRDDYDWNQQSSTLLLCYIMEASDEDFSFTFEEVTLSVFREKIKHLSGGAISIGNKGLTYGTSFLECFLSTTDSLYPGDIDFLMMDNEHHPLAVLEFKKHTLGTSISDQKLTNYYPAPDHRKYNRIALFRDYVDPDIPIFNLFYPTSSNFTEGRLELLNDTHPVLKSKAASNFSLECAKHQEDFLLKKVLKAVKYHHDQL